VILACNALVTSSQIGLLFINARNPTDLWLTVGNAPLHQLSEVFSCRYFNSYVETGTDGSTSDFGGGEDFSQNGEDCLRVCRFVGDWREEFRGELRK
jgi:hypothetical protein